MKRLIHATSYRVLLTAAVAALCAVTTTRASMIGPVNLGTAGDYALLALSGDIQDSGPTGPDANPYSVNGKIGVVSGSGKFQTSGSRTYNGPIYLHTGATYSSSAQGAPPPMSSPAIDAMLAQASADAFAASAFALTLPVTATYGTINNNLTISQGNVGNYVFNIGNISFSGGKSLTLSAPAGSNFILNISSGLTLTGGNILLAGGLTPDHVLINYTGTSAIRFSGGGNSSRLYGTILAPNAHVQITPGFVAGSIIAASIQMSSGANVIPIPEVTPSSVIFGFLGLIVAFSSRRALMARVRTVSDRRKGRLT